VGNDSIADFGPPSAGKIADWMEDKSAGRLRDPFWRQHVWERNRLEPPTPARYTTTTPRAETGLGADASTIRATCQVWQVTTATRLGEPGDL